MSAASSRHAEGLHAEAAVMLDAVEGVDDQYPGLTELQESIDPAIRASMQRGPLGMNSKLRPGVKRSGVVRVLLYLPDRILDLMDVATVGVHFGPGVFLDSHLTRGLQASGGFRSTGGLGLHEHRSLGFKAQAEAGLTVVAVGAQSYGGTLLGTSGVKGSADSMLGLHSPSARLYQDFRDYWAIGASATAAFIGFEFDLHPVQLVDLLAGFVGVDFLNDDLGRTRSLELDAVEPTLLAEMWKVQRSRSALEAYRAARDSESPALAQEPAAPAKPPAEEDIVTPATPVPASPARFD